MRSTKVTGPGADADADADSGVGGVGGVGADMRTANIFLASGAIAHGAANRLRNDDASAIYIFIFLLL